MISFLSRDFDELEEQLKSRNDCKAASCSAIQGYTNAKAAITGLYLRAANLHLYLSAFFDEPSAKDYRERLLSLYVATTSFLEVAMSLETEVGPVLSYTPYYIYQMMVAAGCTLLKLSKSFFAAHIDMEYTKALFNQTIWSIRNVSVSSNDLPERLAEVLAQMWRLGGVVQKSATTTSNTDVDDSLRLKVRCRMSMSLLFDSVWRWREDARTRGRNLEGQSGFFILVLLDKHILISPSLSQEPNQPRLGRRLICCLLRGPTTHLVFHAWHLWWRSQLSPSSNASTD